MHQKKVLFLSPTPTHPTNSGNRQHILSLVNFFKDKNWEVHFLYLEYEGYDQKQMEDFFGSNLYILKKETMFQYKKTYSYIVKNLAGRIGRLKRKLQYKFNIISENQHLYNSEVDGRHSVFIRKFIEGIHREHRFDVVVCEYVYISKYLTFFNSDVFKILDTHDRFTDIFQVYLNLDLKPGWWSLYKDQEKKALNRPDLVLATQERDVDFFSGLTQKDMLIYNFVPATRKLPQKKFEKKLLYIASDTEINKRAIEFFIADIFPLVLQQHPGSRLLIGGTICNKLSGLHEQIDLIGKVASVESFYCMGDVAINPELHGTGYKVKTMEALSFGMPIVATTAGAAGVIEPFQDHLFIADTPELFAGYINRLFEDEVLLKQTSLNAHQWIENCRSRIDIALLKKLPAA